MNTLCHQFCPLSQRLVTALQQIRRHADDSAACEEENAVDRLKHIRVIAVFGLEPITRALKEENQ